MLYEKPTVVTLTLAELENAEMNAMLQQAVISIRPIGGGGCECQCQCQCQCQQQAT